MKDGRWLKERDIDGTGTGVWNDARRLKERDVDGTGTGGGGRIEVKKLLQWLRLGGIVWPEKCIR